MNRSRLHLALALTCSLMGCDSPSDPDPDPDPDPLSERVTIDPGPLPGVVGDSTQVFARVVGEDGHPIEGAEVAWITSVLLPYGRCRGNDCSPVPYATRVVAVSRTDEGGHTRMMVVPPTEYRLEVIAQAGPFADTTVIDPEYAPDIDSLFTWSPVAPMPMELGGAAVAGFGDRIYIVGGHSFDLSGYWRTWSLDPVADTWTEHPDAWYDRSDRFDFGLAATLADGIHVINGTEHTVYDPAADEWTQRASAPDSATAGILEAVDGRLLMVARSGEVHAYDPEEDAWLQRTSIPRPRPWAASAVLDGRIYVAGGGAATGRSWFTWWRNWVDEAPVDRYDPIADEWEALEPLPYGRRLTAGGAIDGKFCVFGGGLWRNFITVPFRDTHCYDPETGEWFLAPPVPYDDLVFTTAVEFGGDLFAIGGLTQEHVWQPTRTVMRLTRSR